MPIHEPNNFDDPRAEAMAFFAAASADPHAVSAPTQALVGIGCAVLALERTLATFGLSLEAAARVLAEAEGGSPNLDVTLEDRDVRGGSPP